MLRRVHFGYIGSYGDENVHLKKGGLDHILLEQKDLYRSAGGGTIYNKFVRIFQCYNFWINFFEAGNNWNSQKILLGIDWGYGFDKLPGQPNSPVHNSIFQLDNNSDDQNIIIIFFTIISINIFFSKIRVC